MTEKDSNVRLNEKDGTSGKSPREVFDEAARDLSSKEWVVADGGCYVVLKHGMEVTCRLTDDGLLRATAPTGVVVPPDREAEVKALETYFVGWCHKFGTYEHADSGEVILSCVIPLDTSEDMTKAVDILRSMTLKLPAIKKCVAGKAPTKSLAGPEDARGGVPSTVLSRLFDSIG